jgi:hypothetical protein
MPPRVSAQALGESVRDDAVEAVRAMQSSGSGLLSRIGPDPLGLLWQIAAISTWSSIPVLGCIEAPPWWSAATAIGPSYRRTVGCLRRASATPALSQSKPDTPCKRHARRPLWLSWWSSFSIRCPYANEAPIRRPVP